ncbi:MAG: hypothetical protein WC046_05810 [Candidatus Bathyarchaeia archaeon]
MEFVPPKSPRKSRLSKLDGKNKRIRRISAQNVEERRIPTEQDIVELTLKRLHILGKQRFGVFPYSEHFDCWAATVETVLAEFISNPSIGVDDEFVVGCKMTLDRVNVKLGEIRCREASVGQEISKLSDYKNQLQQIDNEFFSRLSIVRGQNNSKIRRLNQSISKLKEKQDKIIKTKSGFFHRVSKKERERREALIVEQIINKQTELEVTMLDLKYMLKMLQEGFDKCRDPIFEEIKISQKRVDALETDSSLEERWFACEALIDELNLFLQRKSQLK